MRARRKHKEAYLTFSPYFFSFLRNFPLSKCTGYFCPQMTWKGFSGGNQVRICVIPYYRTIDSWGRSNRMWSSHIIAETGDEMEWFSFQPTSRSLEDVLTFSCFIFFPVAATHEIILFLKTRLAPISGPLWMLFSLPRMLYPNLHHRFSGNPPLTLQMRLASCVLFLAICLHIL